MSRLVTIRCSFESAKIRLTKSPAPIPESRCSTSCTAVSSSSQYATLRVAEATWLPMNAAGTRDSAIRKIATGRNSARCRKTLGSTPSIDELKRLVVGLDMASDNHARLTFPSGAAAARKCGAPLWKKERRERLMNAESVRGSMSRWTYNRRRPLRERRDFQRDEFHSSLRSRAGLRGYNVGAVL